MWHIKISPVPGFRPDVGQYAIPRKNGIKGLRALKISLFRDDGHLLNTVHVPYGISRPLATKARDDVRKLVDKLTRWN